MTCVSGLPELASRNEFVKRLDELGFHVDFINGYFVIFGIPYLDHAGVLQHADLISQLDLAADGLIAPPRSHQTYFTGEKPHSAADSPLKISAVATVVTVSPGLASKYSFSCMLHDENGQKRPYKSFEEKIQTYLDLITAPAIAAYPEDAKPLRGLEIKAAAQNSPLRIPDMLSAHYNINDMSSHLRDKKVAIIGLGGTGSYILDFLARTHLAEITLFDADIVHMHTMFRIPGFIPHAIGKPKVEALAKCYSQWHGNIIPKSELITQENVASLEGLDFVFVSVDDGPSRRLIVDWLSAKGIPFVDTGMGLNRLVNGLNGTVRITGTDRAAFDKYAGTAYLPTLKAPEDDYRRQAQIAELNALNAAFAVIRFKQSLNFYDRLDESRWYTFETSSFDLDKEDSAK